MAERLTNTELDTLDEAIAYARFLQRQIAPVGVELIAGLLDEVRTWRAAAEHPDVPQAWIDQLPRVP